MKKIFNYLIINHRHDRGIRDYSFVFQIRTAVTNTA